MRTVPRSLLATLVGLFGVVALAAALSTPAAPETASVGTGGGRGVARAVAATTLLLALLVVPLAVLFVARGEATATGDVRLAGVVVVLACLLLAAAALLAAPGGGAELPTPGGGLGPFEPTEGTADAVDRGPGGTGLAGIAVVAAVGLAGAGLLVLRLREPPESLDEAESGGHATRGAVAATAGAAADRLAERDRPVDNVVYRAWRELTAALDVGEPASTTPGEFAAAAVDAGVDPDAVAELTAVFEAVRYGDGDPERYAERARAALEAVEREAER